MQDADAGEQCHRFTTSDGETEFAQWRQAWRAGKGLSTNGAKPTGKTDSGFRVESAGAALRQRPGGRGDDMNVPQGPSAPRVAELRHRHGLRRQSDRRAQTESFADALRAKTEQRAWTGRDRRGALGLRPRPAEYTAHLAVDAPYGLRVQRRSTTE